MSRLIAPSTRTRPHLLAKHGRVRSCAGAFTLIEVILAIILIALLLTATFLSISQLVRSRDSNTSKAEAFNRAWMAVDFIAGDAQSLIRSANLVESKVKIIAGPGNTPSDGLLLFTHISRPIRPGSGQPEGEECEAQFRLEPGVKPDEFELWRRVQPVPDFVTDGGGVATPLVQGLTSLSVEAFDGTNWTRTWDSDSDGLPHALRLTVTATDGLAQTTATARRVISVDRTPIPPPADTASTTTATGTGTGTTSSTSGGSSR